MRYKRVVLFFCIALPISVLMRLLQLKYTIDLKSGFMKPEYKNIGFYMILVIVAFSVVMAVLTLFTHRNPEKVPKGNVFLSLSSAAFAGAILYELFNSSFSDTVRVWQNSLLILTGVFSAIYFLAFAVKFFIPFKLPALTAAVPTLYLIMKIICTFSSISSLQTITDYVLIIAAYCLSLIFMLCFAKLYNGIDLSNNYKKLLASGLPAAIICFTQSVPHMIISLDKDVTYNHTSIESNLSVFFCGLFIMVFIFSHFSKRNVEKIKKHRTVNTADQQYYI